MQSEGDGGGSEDAAAVRAELLAQPVSVAPTQRILPILIGFIPLAGVCAELVLGLFEAAAFDPFPKPWHAVSALFAGLVLALGPALCVEDRRFVGCRTALVGAATGLGLLYTLLFAPFAPVIIITVILFGMGILAAGPFWSVLVGLSCARRLHRTWKGAGRSTAAFCIVFALGVLLFPAAVVLTDVRGARFAHDVVAVGRAARAADVLPAIARLRAAAPEKILWAKGADRLNGSRFARGWNGRPNGSLLPPILIYPEEVRREDIDAALFAAHGLHRADLAEFEPTRRRSGGGGWMEDWERRDNAFRTAGFEDAAGDSSRNGVLPDFELERSELRVVIDTPAAAASVDWKLTIRNTGKVSREARFGFAVPVDAVASDLHLQINGVEQPAAFAAEGRVVEAYVDVAQRQRRDPALLREVEPGRLRLLVSPVLPQSAQFVRITLAVPLAMESDESTLVLPAIIDHNAKLRPGFEHRLETVIDGEDPVIRNVDGTGVPHRIVIPGAPPLGRRAWARDAHGVCTQKVVGGSAWKLPSRVRLVVERSAEMASVDWKQAFSGWPETTTFKLFVAGDELEVVDGLSPADAAAHLAGLSFAGGVDAKPTLEAAVADAVASIPSEQDDSLILWVHGRMLEEAHILGALHRGLDAYRGELVVMPRGPALNRLAEDLLIVGLARAPSTAFDVVEERIRTFAADGGRPAFTRVFERGAEPPADGIQVSPWLSILEAAQRARRLARLSKDEAAVAIAEDYRLVTAGVGAVVLEREEQYARHELDPETVSAATRGAESGGQGGGQGSPVPEPSTWILVGSALLLLLVRRSFSRP